MSEAIRPIALWGRRSLCALGGLGLALLVAKVTVVNAVPGTANVVGPAPADKMFMRDLTLEYTKTRRLPPDAGAVARRIAREQPLASGPFAILAIEAAERNDNSRAIALLEAGRRRNPRDRLVRMLLLEQYALKGDYVKATEELAAFYRIVPDAGVALVDTMTKIALEPNGFRPLARAMHGERALGPLLANLVKVGAPLETILTLARGAPESDDPEQTVWRKLLLQRLVGEGRYAEARRLWGDFANLPAAARNRPLFNPGLSPSPALEPFNWGFAGETIGAVDLMGRGTASVVYFGRETGPLLTQLLTLAPGRYRFRYAAESGRSAEGDALIWRIRCATPGSAAAGNPLAENPVRADKAGKRASTMQFTVPQACPAQWLSLNGVSTEFPTSRNVEISGLTLVQDQGS